MTQELTEMAQAEKTKFCVLFLCVLCNGCINVASISSQGNASMSIYDAHKCYKTYDKNSDVDAKLVSIMLKVVAGCQLNKNTSIKKILKQLDALNNVYLKKVNHTFKIIHEQLFEYLCYYFGSIFQRIVIENADIAIIRDRTHLRSVCEEYSNFTVIIEEQNEKHYFNRMVCDLSDGNVHDVFYNKQMKYESFRLKFINFITSRIPNIKDLLSIKDNSREKDRNQVSFLYLSCSSGFEDFVNFILNIPEYEADKDFYPLTAAAASGQNDIIRILLSYGVDIDHCDKSGNTPLIAACIGRHKETIKLLIENKADVNKRAIKGATPLMWACTTDYYEIADFLLYKGADIDKPDYCGQTPIMWSRKGANHNVFDLLIYRGANLNKSDNNGWTPLMWACHYGLLNTVRTLVLNGSDINQSDSDGNSPLMIAGKVGNAEIIEFLISKGADINSVNKFGQTSFFVSCLNDQQNICNILIRCDTNIDQQDANGATPLKEACIKGNLNSVEYLMANGANCNISDNEGWTPLMVACFGRYVNIVKCLIENGPAINIKNKNGETALLVSCKTFRFDRILTYSVDAEFYVNKPTIEASCTENQKLIVQLLIDNNGRIDEVDNDGWSPLMHACFNQYLEIANVLIDNGENINHSNNSGISIIQHAASNNSSEILRLLVQKGLNISCEFMKAIKDCKIELVKFLLIEGFDINSRDKLGRTPLMNAIEHNSTNIAEFLIEEGADLNMFDDNGWTALGYACKSVNKNIAQLLIDNGADLNFENMSRITLNEMFRQACQKKNSKLCYELIARCVAINDDCISGLFSSYEFDPGDLGEVLLIACEKANAKVVELLLVHKMTDINIHNENKCTPLMIACCLQENEIFHLLETYGADTYQSFCMACRIQNHTVIQSLLQKSSNLDNVLINACRQNNFELVKVLLDTQFGIMSSSRACTIHSRNIPFVPVNHTNVNAVTPDGENTLVIAYQNNCREILPLLLEKGADTNFAFQWACNHRDIEFMKYLIEKGIDVNMNDNSGWNPLFWVYFMRHQHLQQGRDDEQFINAINLLIWKGADMDFTLNLACNTDCSTAAESLINKGANKNMTDNDGYTLLDKAIESGKDQVATILKSKGAKRKKRCVLM